MEYGSTLRLSHPSDGVTQLLLTRPPANAFNMELVVALKAAVQDLQSQSRCLIITGAGKYFSLGADLKVLAGYGHKEFALFLEAIRSAFFAVETSRIPTIAALNGDAVGGGLELALSCNVRIGAPGARLGLPEIRHGMIPGAGGTQRIIDVVGVGRALDLLVTGRLLSVEEACHWGLVSSLSTGPVDEAAISLAETLASFSVDALHAVYRVMKMRAEGGWLEGYLQEGREIEALIRTPYVLGKLEEFG